MIVNIGEFWRACLCFVDRLQLGYGKIGVQLIVVVLQDRSTTCLLRPPCAEIELFNRLIPSLATSWIVKKPLTTPSLEDLESTTHPILVKTALVKMGEVGVMAICKVKLHFGRTTTRICLWMTLKPWTKSCLDNLPDFGKKLVTFVGRFWHNYCEHVCRDYI